MNRIEALLNCQVQNRGFVENFGNWALTPFAYFFHGRKVEILFNPQEGAFVHHVAAFHPWGNRHVSRTMRELCSDETSMKTAALMIVLLIPGLLIGFLAKVTAYAISPWMRWETELIRNHFTTVDLVGDSATGSFASSLSQVEADLNRNAFISGRHRKVGALEIRSEPGLEFERYLLALRALNPKKLIFHGGQIVNNVLSPVRRLDDVLAQTGKWLTEPRRPEEIMAGMTHLVQRRVASVQEALDDIPPRRGLFGKPYHVVYVIDP